MPTLIIEDGTNVTDANSYIDVAYLDLYATDRDLTIPTDDTDKEYAILRAMDYVEGFRMRFTGTKSNTDTVQELQWPRTDAVIDCADFDDDAIPTELQKAVAQVVVEEMTNPLYPDPLTSTTEGTVTEKSVGSLTKKFANRSTNHNALASSAMPIKFAAVLNLLRPLFKNVGQLTVTRA